MINRRQMMKWSSLAVGSIALPQAILGNDERLFTGFPPGQIRLSANENPYGPSPAARAAMVAAISSSNRYSWDPVNQLTSMIGKGNALTKSHVLLGAGSSEILSLSAQLAGISGGGELISPDPSFSIWQTAAEKTGLVIKKISLDAHKKLDLQAMMAGINQQTRMIYLCNPHNPTGTEHDAVIIQDIISKVPRHILILLDEAYIEYSAQPSLASLVDKFENLVVARTFSKIYGLAGARIGYALAHPTTINKLAAFQPWTNAGPSVVSVHAAIASLHDKSFTDKCLNLNSAARQYSIDALTSLGIRVIPSVTNFIYYEVGEQRENWGDQLSRLGILTGRVNKTSGYWARTSIGTMEEMKHFITAATSIIKN